MGQIEKPDRLEIFERYQPLLFSIVLSILGNEVETQGLLQEMLQIWLQVPESEVAEARTFLVTASAARATEVLSAAEPRWVKPCQVVRRQDGARCGSPRPAPRKTIVKIALKALDGLSAEERSAFFLRTVFKCDYHEISRIIGKDEVECRKIIRKAKRYMSQNRSDLSLLDLSDLSQN